MSNPLVTVAILTFNGEQYIDDILTSIESQNCSFDYEVLVVDSGSTDETIAKVKNHKSVRLHQIPNSEFGHGKTRNLAAQLANGKYIAYLTHDAIPANDSWLFNMVEPLEFDQRIVGVLGRQIPRENCVPMLKYEIQLVFARQGAVFGKTILTQQDMEFAPPSEIGNMSFYSDVNSATRVDFLLNVAPYREVDYAEDHMFAEDFLSLGKAKAYSPQGAVIHSNDLNIHEIGPRTFDEVIALRRLGHLLAPMTKFHLCKMIIRKSLGDSRRMLRDPDIRGGKLIYWMLNNPRYISRKWQAYNRACRVDLMDTDVISASSLEGRKKRGH